MAAFATAADLAAILGIEEFTEAQETRATALLELASGSVRAEARQAIDLVEDDELVRRGSSENTIMLPERPVGEITSITLDGEELDADSWLVDGRDVYRAGGWGHEGLQLVVTYSHGYEEIPEALKTVVLAVAMRAWTNPGGVLSQTLGAASTTFATEGAPSGLLLTEDERRVVRRVVSTGTTSLQIR